MFKLKLGKNIVLSNDHATPTVVYLEYIPLGINCEVAFQIRRILGFDSSSFFSWNVTKMESVISLLEHRFAGILNWDDITPVSGNDLLSDPSHDFKFHSPFLRGRVKDDSEFDQKREIFEKKVAYLTEKFFIVRAPNDYSAYFYKYDGNDSPVYVHKRALRIRDLLCEIHRNGNFVLVILQHESRTEAPWAEPNLSNRYLKRVSPWSDATDGHVQSWDRVFRDFPHRAPLRLAGFG
jgi:hypothetical protein